MSLTRRPRRPGFLAIAILATVLIPAHLSPTRAKARPRVVDIAGSVVFTAKETSTTRVRFAKGLHWSDVEHVHIKGQGRLFGFILRKVGRYEQESRRPWFKSMLTSACDTRACKTPREEHPGAVGFGSIDELGGVWDVYVVADGAPVRVELLVDGSKVRDEIRVKGPVASELRTLPVRTQVEEGGSLHIAGAFTKLKDTDHAHISIWAMGEPYVASVSQRCAYYKEEDEPPVNAFGPQCPNSPEMLQAPLADHTSGPRRQPVYSYGFADGERGIGAWLTTAGVVTEVAAVGLWIDFPGVDVKPPTD